MPGQTTNQKDTFLRAEFSIVAATKSGAGNPSGSQKNYRNLKICGKPNLAKIDNARLFEI
jgi:hypothetical protein